MGPVVTRSVRTARAAVQFIGAGKPSAGRTEEIAEADLVLLATPDDQIVSCAKALARVAGNWRVKVVLHTSGAHSSKALAALKRRGASVGSWHPVYPFPQALRVLPAGIVFGIEGTPRAVREAAALTRALRGVAVKVRARDKALYHAAAAMVAGHLVTLIDLGTRMMVRAGLPRSQARRALLPLIEQAVADYGKRGEKAWVGPLQRGDIETVQKHRRALGRMPPIYRDAYLSLARAAVTLYQPGGRKTTRALHQALQQGKR